MWMRNRTPLPQPPQSAAFAREIVYAEEEDEECDTVFTP